MIDKRTIRAIELQVEHAINLGKTDKAYYGLRIALLSIIQAHNLTQEQAQLVVNEIGIYVTNGELAKWIRS